MSKDEPLLVFRVGSYEYGIPVTEMREIARVGELRSIPGAGAGIVTDRNVVLPIDWPRPVPTVSGVTDADQTMPLDEDAY